MLLKEIRAWVWRLKFLETVVMFYWPEDKLRSEKAWRLDDVYQRTLAARSLGYEVIIEADEKGMAMKYRKKAEVPYRWQT